MGRLRVEWKSHPRWNGPSRNQSQCSTSPPSSLSPRPVRLLWRRRPWRPLPTPRAASTAWRSASITDPVPQCVRAMRSKRRGWRANSSPAALISISASPRSTAAIWPGWASRLKRLSTHVAIFLQRPWCSAPAIVPPATTRPTARRRCGSPCRDTIQAIRSAGFATATSPVWKPRRSASLWQSHLLQRQQRRSSYRAPPRRRPCQTSSGVRTPLA